MKNKLFGCFILVLLVSLAFIACGGVPPPPGPAPDAGASVSQEEINSLNAAADRAARARQMAVDFHASGYFPSEWQSADSLFNRAEASRSTATQADARESAVNYNAAADVLEAVAERAAAQYTQDQQAVLEDARERAIRAGAKELAEDYLLQADNKAAEILPPYEAKDYYGAGDKLIAALEAYGALETGLLAYDLRMKLDERGFETYDSETLEAVDADGLSAIEDYGAGNIKDAAVKAEDVLERYLAYEAQWLPVYVVDAADSAAAERQRALDVRANVAARFEFEAGDGFYSRAQEFNEGEDFSSAADLFDRAKAQFVSAYRLTVQRRDLAEEALKETDLMLAESDENARRAEELLEGGTK